MELPFYSQSSPHKIEGNCSRTDAESSCHINTIWMHCLSNEEWNEMTLILPQTVWIAYKMDIRNFNHDAEFFWWPWLLWHSPIHQMSTMNCTMYTDSKTFHINSGLELGVTTESKVPHYCVQWCRTCCHPRLHSPTQKVFFILCDLTSEIRNRLTKKLKLHPFLKVNYRVLSFKSAVAASSTT